MLHQIGKIPESRLFKRFSGISLCLRGFQTVFCNFDILKYFSEYRNLFPFSEIFATRMQHKKPVQHGCNTNYYQNDDRYIAQIH